jgi:hypothetical protein
MFSTFQNENTQKEEVKEKDELSTEFDRIFVQSIFSTKNFGYSYFPDIFYAKCHSLLQQMLDALDGNDKNLLILAPRGMGKTSWILYGYCARQLLCGLVKFLVYLGNSSTLAIRATDNLKRALVYDKMIKDVFGEQNPQVLQSAGNSADFASAGWSLTNGSFIIPRGVGQQVRGLQMLIDNKVMRPQLIVIDDLESSTEVKSPEQRAKLKEWFFADLMKIETKYKSDCRIVYIDTLKHDDALAASLMKEPSWKTLILSVCDDNFKSNAPEFMSDAQIKAEYELHVRQDVEDVFFREYRNIPISTKNRAFKASDFRYYYECSNGQVATISSIVSTALKDKFATGSVEVSTLGNVKENLYTLNYSENSSSSFITTGTKMKAYNIIICDPAKTQNIASADTAIVWITVTELGLLFIRRIICGKFNPTQIYEHIAKICSLSPIYRIAIEVTGLSLFVSQPFKQYMKDVGYSHLANSLIELAANRTKKEERIGWLSPYYQRHQIYHNIADHVGLEQQLLSFPSSKKLDIMDCTAWIVWILGKLEFSFSTSLTDEYPSEEENKINWSMYS